VNYDSPIDWTFPVPIAYGPGRLGEIARSCRRLGINTPLVVTDRKSSDLPFVQFILDALCSDGLGAALFCDISPNPRDTEIAAGCEKFRHNDHDGVIAVGGGSGLDGGKAICLQAMTGRDLWSFDFDAAPEPIDATMSFPKLITVPTTAGSGAETAGTAMITHTGKSMKLCVWHPDFDPSLCILDPTLTLALPPELTAWTGCDAIVHAIEAYSVPILHPMCDGIALQALELVWRHLPVAVREPDNLEARSGLLIGSCLAGVSFLKGLGLVHAISHMIGAEYDTHHGLTNAVVLPSVLDFNATSLPHKMPHIAAAIRARGADFGAVRHEVLSLLDQLQIPDTLAELGVTAESMPQIAVKAALDVAAHTNPRRASVTEITEIMQFAHQVGR